MIFMKDKILKSKFIKCSFCFLLLINFTFFHLFSQTSTDEFSEFAGEWQNSSKFINFDFENNNIIHELKTFYGLWRDKKEFSKIDKLKVLPLVYENQLFMQYWILDDFFKTDKNSKLKLYLPKNNVDEILLDNPEIYQELYAYLFVNEIQIVKIRYWVVNLDLEEEVLINQKATITENTVNLTKNNTSLDLKDEGFRNIKKYLKIGDMYYTCVEGRGTNIRNIEILEKKDFSVLKIINKNDESYLLLQNPYMYRTID